MYNTIEETKLIVIYIYIHKVNVSLRRVHKKNDLLQALKISIVMLCSG
jgi:hypothetical protein